jgi:outer membrane protein OmpA-like peptidoglycan-associated protein
VRQSAFVRRTVRTLSRVALAGLLAAAALLTAERASAQASYFYLDRAQISGAPDDGFIVWRPHLYDETRFYGMAALGYSHNPLRDETVTDGETENYIQDPVRGQLITYLSIGTEITRRFALNLSLPIMLYKVTTEDPLAQQVGEGGIDGNRVALHDLRFDARVLLYENDTKRFRLGLGGALWAPTGNGIAFTGDSAASALAYLSSEVDFKKWFLTGMMGPQYKPERSIGGQYGRLFTGSELRFAFGGFLPLRKNEIRLGVELWGTTGIQEAGGESTVLSSRNTDIEWLGQARFLLDKRQRIWAMGGFGTRLFTGYGAPDFRMLASIGTFLTLKDFASKSPPPKVQFTSDGSLDDPDTDGDGYPDSIDQCPTIKEDGKPPNPSDGCPADADRDGDGIPDSVDECPDKPEDKDGIEDKDGCPEDDADGDGIPDTEDKCPTKAGKRSQKKDQNGCPLTQVDEEGVVQLLQPIEFEFGKAVIKAVSFPILDEVVELMKSRSTIKLGVYGHTDNQGADALNLRLSRERAAACKNYLISHGIAGSRLESQGFGPTQPVADNNTDAGRAKNRRVDFKILKE